MLTTIRHSFGEAGFAAVMARLGPWETAPRLAVAVSGGADSLALTLLADGWARSRGGSVLALTVDHGLRPEAATEARQVGGWLAAQGIAHRILRWDGDKPAHGLQAAARQARYALLRRAAAEAGLLHLMLAHHRDDQSETLLQRLTRGSGVDGLAAMSPIVELPELRLLRPLLDVPRVALQAFLAAQGQDWVEDPSNRSDAYQRVRMRGFLQAEGLEAQRLAATSRAMGRARQALEEAVADLTARAVDLHPAGFLTIAPRILRAAPDEVGLRLLANCCRCISGAEAYPPRLEKLERLLAELDGLTGRRSFGGCLIAPSRGGRLLISRETARLAPAVSVDGAGWRHWDGRFRLRLSGPGRGQLGALGADGLAELRAQGVAVPFAASVAVALPALKDSAGVSAVPHLRYKRVGAKGLVCESAIFAPARPLAGFVHCLVSRLDGIM